LSQTQRNRAFLRAVRRITPRLLGLLWLAAGCVPISGLPDGGTNPTPDGGDGTTPDATFTVSIQASNRTPQLYEEVTLQCFLSGNATAPVTFGFQSRDVTMTVNATSGTASFVVSESELDIAIDVTCSATDADNYTAMSNRISIFPTQ